MLGVLGAGVLQVLVLEVLQVQCWVLEVLVLEVLVVRCWRG